MAKRISDSSQTSPPQWPLKLLGHFLKESYLEEIEGDMEERFYDNIERYHSRKARQLYVRDSFKLLRPALMKKVGGDVRLNHYGMFKYYLKTGYRSLIRDKAYSVINILGLAVGMGACLMIAQYLFFEMSYDQFHNDYENTYRVVLKEANTELQETYPNIGHAFGPAAQAKIPEVKRYIRKERFFRGAIVTNPENQHVFHEAVNDLLFVDPSFFQVFNFPLTSGNYSTLFSDKYNIVITESTAKKYFSTEDPIGKTLNVNGPPSPGDYTVSGVLEDPPPNSHFQFDFLMPIDNYLTYGWGGAVKNKDGWNGFSVITYLHLDASANLNLVTAKLNDLIALNKRQGDDIVEEVILQPIADIYLKSSHLTDAGFIDQLGNEQSLWVFTIVSFLILLMAWVNYINLATARAMQRTKEVGIRKSMGAYRNQLLGQFILESLLTNIFAALLSLGLASLFLPLLNDILSKEITMSLYNLPKFWIGFVLVFLLGTMLSGLYPAFVMSSFRPIAMLRFYGNSAGGNTNLRKWLITFQFIISLLLISATYMVYKQTSFMKNRDLGMNLEQILILRGPQVNIDTVNHYAAFFNELRNHHSISSASGSLMVPGQYWILPYHKLGQSPSDIPHTRGFFASLDFDKTYSLQMMAGQGFTKDMMDHEAVIINEAAVQAFGFSTPEDALSQKLKIGSRARTIVGVVKNFHWHSLAEDHKPYVIDLYEKNAHPYLSIRVNTSNLKETLQYVESTFQTHFPANPFEYFFASESFNRQYSAEQQFGKLFLSFSALAIFIGCIGLFALVSYAANMKVKEIGIRKVLGASIKSIVLLVSKEYFKLIVLATVLATPLIWIAGKSWLDNYAYHVSLGLDIFFVPIIILVLIAILTVSHRTISSATANPVDSLRDE